MTKKNLPEVSTAKKYAVMEMEKGAIAEILEENLGGEQLTARDLEMVTVPAGGGITWTISTIDGDVDTKEIDGIIIFTQITRAYWPTKYTGGNEPPQCSSQDGLTGQGDPGGNCLDCPFNEFGSAIADDGGPGRGKACSEMRFIFIVTENETLPIVVRAPATSLEPVKKYLFGLTSARKLVHSVYTRLTLKRDKNADGVVFSKIMCQKIGDVENPELSAAYAAGIKPHLMKVAQEASLEQDDQT